MARNIRLGKEKSNKEPLGDRPHQSRGGEEKRHKMIEEAKKIYKDIKGRILKSLKLEILGMAAVGLGISAIAFSMVKTAINETGMGRGTYVTYDESKARKESELLELIQRINQIENESYDIVTELEQEHTIEALLDSVKNLEREDALLQLRETLDRRGILTAEREALITQDTLNSNEGSSSEEKEVSMGITSLQQALDTLHNELRQVSVQPEMDLERAKKAIRQFYDSQGITGAKIKSLRIREALRAIGSPSDASSAETYLIDGTGKILYQEGFIQSLDVKKVIQKVNSYTQSSHDGYFAAIFPVIIEGTVHYLFSECDLTPTTHYYYKGIGGLLGFFAAVGVFTVLLFQFIKPKIDYIEYLSNCLEEIAKGDLSYQIDKIGQDELAKVASNITSMEAEIKKQIEAQVKAEKVKNELVTNVAHDLRTPLTSIIGYIGLVKNKQFTNKEEEARYLDIAYSKAEKLKGLIEDLFELTKLHQQAGHLSKEVISLTNLLNQLVEELMPLATEKNIELETIIQGKEASIRADIPKITRVFENIIGNAIKYSDTDEQIKVELFELPKEVKVIVTNPCNDITEEEVAHFFDRFYRADKSRNSLAGGSGLGLAIAKNIVELHGGKITATLQEGVISFKVRLPKYRMVKK